MRRVCRLAQVGPEAVVEGRAPASPRNLLMILGRPASRHSSTPVSPKRRAGKRRSRPSRFFLRQVLKNSGLALPARIGACVGAKQRGPLDRMRAARIADRQKRADDTARRPTPRRRRGGRSSRLPIGRRPARALDPLEELLQRQPPKVSLWPMYDQVSGRRGECREARSSKVNDAEMEKPASCSRKSRAGPRPTTPGRCQTHGIPAGASRRASPQAHGGKSPQSPQRARRLRRAQRHGRAGPAQ